MMRQREKQLKHGTGERVNRMSEEKEPSVCDNCERGDYWECYFCCAKCIEDYGECPDPECDPIGDI